MMGMSMKVKKSSLDEVRGKMEAVKRKIAERKARNWQSPAY